MFGCFPERAYPTIRYVGVFPMMVLKGAFLFYKDKDVLYKSKFRNMGKEKQDAKING